MTNLQTNWTIKAKDAKRLTRLLDQKAFVKAEQLMDKLVAGVSIASLGYENLVNFARLKMEVNKPGDAEKLASMAIGLDDQKTDAPEILFSVYLKQNLFTKALSLIDRLIEHDPSAERYQYYKILTLSSLNQSDEVLTLSEALILRKPEYERDPQLHHAVINALIGDGRYPEASARLDRAKLAVDTWNPWIALIEPNVLLNSGRAREALESLDVSMKNNPANSIWQWNRALTKLALGDLEGGWRDYESRWAWDEFPSPKRALNLPLWDKHPLEGKSIVVSAEQGVGDQIMFGVAIAGLLKLRPKKLRLELQKKLVPLFKLWYPEAHVVEFQNNSEIDRQLEAEFDYHIPMATLAGYFFRSQAEIDQLPRRRLRLADGEVERLIGNFADQYPVRIGLSWRSHAVDGSRKSGYMNVNFCTSILESLPRDIGFVIVQYRFERSEKLALEQYPNVFVPDDDLFDDPVLNGKYCACCDVVVSAATAVVPLAGLFGVPTITWGIRDTWVDLGRKDFPWFPNILKIRYEHFADKRRIVMEIIERLKTAIDPKESNG
jgi:tetratricopeptide (TPR) repeat protein